MDRMDKAADYTDEWFMMGDGESRVGVRVYYICNRQVGYERCNTLTISSGWFRKHSDPLAYGQKWYCTICRARYKTTQGVLVLFTHNGVESYVRAAIPPDHMQT